MKNMLDFTANPETLKQTPPQHTQKRKVQQHWKNLGNGKNTHTNKQKTTKNRSSSTTNSLIPTTETLQLRWCLDNNFSFRTFSLFRWKKYPIISKGKLFKKLQKFQNIPNFHEHSVELSFLPPAGVDDLCNNFDANSCCASAMIQDWNSSKLTLSKGIWGVDRDRWGCFSNIRNPRSEGVRFE